MCDAKTIEASEALEEFVNEMIKRSAKKKHYLPRFKKMRKLLNTKRAIAKLMVSSKVQYGFEQLVKNELLDWTLESAVLKFQNEFSPDIVECARFRIKMVKTKLAEKS